MNFSFELDQILINHVKEKGMTNRKWQRLAESTELVDANECRQRWDRIHNHTNIEYKCLLLSPRFSARSTTDQHGSGVLRHLPPPVSSESHSHTIISQSDHDIVIHVRDEGRQISRDFICSKRLLLSEMSYFQHYLENCRSTDDIDISVHCDVHIFDWLMKYIKEEPHPELAPKTIVSILISSDFLKISKLISESIEYFVQHSDEILQVPIDLSCINNNLLAQLAASFSVERLHCLKDPTDKIISSLYKFKLKHLLELPCNQLFVCVACGSLFTDSQFEAFTCSKAKIDFDVYGRTIARHQRDSQVIWDVNLCLTGLRAEGMPWSEIFWKFWAVITSLSCSKCGCFSISEFGHCRYHGCEPVFSHNSDSGRYQCCKMAVLKFDTIDGSRGCRAQNHVVDTTNQDRSHLEIMLDRRSSILIPFSPEINEISLLSRLGLQSTLQLTSKLMARTTVLRDIRNRSSETTVEQLVQMQKLEIEFGESELTVGVDDDGLVLSDDSSDDGLIKPLQVFDSGSDDDSNHPNTLSRASSTTYMKKTNSTVNRRKKKSSKSLSKMSVTQAAAKHRIHKLDSLRDDDRARMQCLVHKLADMRNDGVEIQSHHFPLELSKTVRNEKFRRT